MGITDGWQGDEGLVVVESVAQDSDFGRQRIAIAVKW